MGPQVGVDRGVVGGGGCDPWDFNRGRLLQFRSLVFFSGPPTHPTPPQPDHPLSSPRVGGPTHVLFHGRGRIFTGDINLCSSDTGTDRTLPYRVTGGKGPKTQRIASGSDSEYRKGPETCLIPGEPTPDPSWPTETQGPQEDRGRTTLPPTVLNTNTRVYTGGPPPASYRVPLAEGQTKFCHNPCLSDTVKTPTAATSPSGRLAQEEGLGG